MRLSGVNAMWIGYRLLEAAAPPDFPQVVNGCLKLQEPNDLTWHCLQLYNDVGQPIPVTTFVVQANTTSAGRGYVIMTADDLTKHKLELLLDGGEYRWNIDPSNSAEASDYASFNLGDGTNLYTVTMIKEVDAPTTSYTLYVNQTPVP